MKTTANVSALILLAICSTSAMAEGGKFYAAIDLGQTKAVDSWNCIKDFPFPSDWTCKDTAGAVRIAGGYQFTQMFGMEVSYADFGTLENSGSLPYPWVGINSVKYKISGYALHATATLPINDSFSLLGKLGIARSKGEISATSINTPSFNVNDTSSSTKASFGVGAKYAFSDQVDFRVQYDKFGAGGDSNVGRARFDLLSAGAVYKF